MGKPRLQHCERPPPQPCGKHNIVVTTASGISAWNRGADWRMEHWIPIIRDWLAGHQSWLVIAIVGTAFLESLAIIGLLVPAMAIMFAV